MTAINGDRLLVLVRHAKSVPKDAAPDFDRPLADRGRREAPKAGEWLAESGYRVDFALCSSARRTRQTWQLMVPGLSEPPPVVYEDRLYNASTDSLMAVLRETDESVTGLLVVGHNPGIHELAVTLCGNGGRNEEGLLHRIHEGFPTAAVVVVALPDGWQELAPGAGRPKAFWAPHG
ncbi:histidine phosphatase family protein [Streptomyces sp. AP-93]|uniref:SixA phosphatase family protein n=1 Tax=Streptomyces sp. AP-93 TaxID=2929048 RepID=UPI001FAFCAF5|nr:histidine phosphatase family protein [Streptomyces sp. AP-93]MCJ0869711.1 histidine phosphatase family protein [Streptomyces sp. AP-93]